MTDDFASLYAYNRWADRRVLEACRRLTIEQYVSEPASGWSSVRASVVHIAAVTDRWLRCLSGEVLGPGPKETEVPTLEEAESLFEHADRTLASLLLKLTSEWLANPVTLQGGGRTAVLPPWAVLRHIVNHSTYHRGQVASKLKRWGVEPPVTDFVAWVSEQQV